jgi:uncharacterized protein (TIGR01777 family)
MSERVLVTGASGFIGRKICQELVDSHYEVIALSRRACEAKEKLGDNVKVVQWDFISATGCESVMDGALAIINLAGENIATGKWMPMKKQQILESRINVGKAIVAVAEKTTNKPHVLIQASGVGYYGNAGDELLSENSVAGTGFLADVARRWEQSIRPVEASGVRLVIIRLGAVLGRSGGFIGRILPAYRFCFSGYIGKGKQWFSWIHIDDVVGAIRFLMANTDLKGVFNLTSPNPVVSKKFYQLLGKVMHCPAIFPIPEFALKLLYGEQDTNSNTWTQSQHFTIL